MRFLLEFVLILGLSPQAPQFDVQSRLVLVPTTVTDSKGHAVDGLAAADFLVLDNGRPQKVTVDTIGTGVAPIALVVAIQTSNISKAVLEKVVRIGSMIEPLVTGERGCAAVLTFSTRVAWLEECTHDEDRLSRAFARVRPGVSKDARMLDAVHESIVRLARHANSRRVLLLISESRDRGSEADLSAAVAAAQSAGVSVYGATYSAFAAAFTSKSSATGDPRRPEPPVKPSDTTGTVTGAPPQCGPFGCVGPPIPPSAQTADVMGGIGELLRLGKTNTTQALAQATGGAIFRFARLKGLENAIQKLGAELHSQYVLSYTPDDATRGYHRLEVRVAGDRFSVRARPGYWSNHD